MNFAYATSSTNSIDNIVGLDPTAGDLLRAVGGGGLQYLEIVTKSEDALSPSLKAAVADTLAIIGMTKKFNSNKKAWAEFSESLIGHVEGVVQFNRQYGEDHVLHAWQSSLEHLNGVLNYLKERVSDVQPTQGRRFPSFTEDMGYIEELKDKLNEAMGTFNFQGLRLQWQNNPCIK